MAIISGSSGGRTAQDAWLNRLKRNEDEERKRKKLQRLSNAQTGGGRAPTMAPVHSSYEKQVRDFSLAYHRLYKRMPAATKTVAMLALSPPGLDSTDSWYNFLNRTNPLTLDPGAAGVLLKSDHNVQPIIFSPRLPLDEQIKQRDEAAPGGTADAGPNDPGAPENIEGYTEGTVKGGGRGYSAPKQERQAWTYSDPDPGVWNFNEIFYGEGVEPAYQGRGLNEMGHISPGQATEWGSQGREPLVGNWARGTTPMMKPETVKSIMTTFTEDMYYRMRKRWARNPEDEKANDFFASFANLKAFMYERTGRERFDKDPGIVVGWDPAVMREYQRMVLERNFVYLITVDQEEMLDEEGKTYQQYETARMNLLEAGIDAGALIAGIEAMDQSDRGAVAQMAFDGFIRWRPDNQTIYRAKYEYSNKFGLDAMPPEDAEMISDVNLVFLDEVWGATKATAGAVGGAAKFVGEQLHRAYDVTPLDDITDPIWNSPQIRAARELVNVVNDVQWEVAKGIGGASMWTIDHVDRAAVTAYTMQATWDSDHRLFGGSYHDFGSFWAADSWGKAWEQSEGKWVMTELVGDIAKGTGLMENPENSTALTFLTMGGTIAVGLNVTTLTDLAIVKGATVAGKGAFGAARMVGRPLKAAQDIRSLKKIADTALPDELGPATLYSTMSDSEMSRRAMAAHLVLSRGEAGVRKMAPEVLKKMGFKDPGEAVRLGRRVLANDELPTLRNEAATRIQHEGTPTNAPRMMVGEELDFDEAFDAVASYQRIEPGAYSGRIALYRGVRAMPDEGETAKIAADVLSGKSGERLAENNAMYLATQAEEAGQYAKGGTVDRYIFDADGAKVLTREQIVDQMYEDAATLRAEAKRTGDADLAKEADALELRARSGHMQEYDLYAQKMYDRGLLDAFHDADRGFIVYNRRRLSFGTLETGRRSTHQRSVSFKLKLANDPELLYKIKDPANDPLAVHPMVKAVNDKVATGDYAPGLEPAAREWAAAKRADDMGSNVQTQKVLKKAEAKLKAELKKQNPKLSEARAARTWKAGDTAYVTWGKKGPAKVTIKEVLKTGRGGKEPKYLIVDNGREVWTNAAGLYTVDEIGGAAKAAAKAAPAAKPEKAAPPAKPKMTKAKDFDSTGNQYVEIDGKKTLVYYDRGNSTALRGWYRVEKGVTGEFLGDNKAEMLKKLSSPAEEVPTPAAVAALDTTPIFKTVENTMHEPPTSLEGWKAQVRLALEVGEASDDEVERIASLVRGIATYTGDLPDDFVTRRLLGVIRGDGPVEFGTVTSELHKLGDVTDENTKALRAYVETTYGVDHADQYMKLVTDYVNNREFMAYRGGTKAAEYRRLGEGADASMVDETGALKPTGLALSQNEKTIMSVDFSTDCPWRQEGRACFYCYAELKRGKGALQYDEGIAAGMTEKQARKREAAAKGKLVVNAEQMKFDSVWIEKMDDATVGFFNSVGGMRVFSFGDWSPEIADVMDEFMDAARARGLDVKIITKQRETVKRYGRLAGRAPVEGQGRVWMNYSVDADPIHLEGILTGKKNRRLSRMLTDRVQRNLLLNTETVDEAYAFVKDYDNVVLRYVSAFGDDEYMRAIMDPRIGNVTPLHTVVSTPEKTLPVWQKAFPRLYAEVGPRLLTELAESWQNRPHPAQYVKGGSRASGVEKRLAKNGIKATEDEYFDAVAKKTCCVTGRCGGCQSCCGMRAKESNLLWSMEGRVAQASVQFYGDGRALIRALEAPDAPAMVHEVGHIFRRQLQGKDALLARRWAGLDETSAWTRAAEEKFADAFAEHFDEYLRTGRLPSEMTQSIMERFRDWLATVWSVVKGTPNERLVSKQMRELFDQVAEPLRVERKAEQIGTAGYFSNPGKGSLPLGLQNHSEFIASIDPGPRSEWWIRTLYNLPNEPEVKAALRDLVKMTDPEKVKAKLVDMADEFNVVIDPMGAATMKYMRMKFYSGGYLRNPTLVQAMLNPLVDTVHSDFIGADQQVLRIGTSIKMGNPKTGRSLKGLSAEDYAVQLFHAEDATEQARIWDDFWEDVKGTLESRRAPRMSTGARKMLKIEKGAEPQNMWEYWELYKKRYYQVKGQPKAMFGHSRAWKPSPTNPDVETSTVVPSGLNQRLASKLQQADNELQKALTNPNLKPEVRQALETKLDAAREAFSRYMKDPEAFARPQPFFEWQLRKGYTHPFDPALFQKFMAGNQSRKWELAQVYAIGGKLSIDEAVSAYKEMVMGTMGFPLRVTIGDEGVRLATEGILFSPLRMKRDVDHLGGWKQFFGKGFVNDMIDAEKLPPELIEDLTQWTRSHSDDFVVIDADHPKHLACLNGELRRARGETMFKIYTRFRDEEIAGVLAKRGGAATLSADDYETVRKNVVKRIRREVNAESEDGAALRTLLTQTHRTTNKAADAKKIQFSKSIEDQMAGTSVHRANPATQYLEQWIEYIDRFEGNEVLRRAMWGDRSTTKPINPHDLSPEEWRRIPKDSLWPVIMQNEAWVLNPAFHIPVASWFAQNVTFKMMSAISDRMRTLVFTHRYLDEVEAMKGAAKRRGWDFDADKAHRIASQKALAYTNSVQYTHNSTVFENLARNTIMFMPAYRQYFQYWGKFAATHPTTMAYIMGWNMRMQEAGPRTSGDWSGYVPPIPFGFDVPTFAPTITVPAKIVNSMTNGGLEGIENLPGMDFASPRSAVISRFDDLLYGIGGWSLGPLSADKANREKISLRIAAGQASKGIKPDPEQGWAQIRETPGWWNFLESLGVEHPEAIASFVTKQLNPTGGLTYMPEAARKYYDAEYEMNLAGNNTIERARILSENPDYAKVLAYRTMTKVQKEKWLADPENIHLLPYLTAQNDYDGAGLIFNYNDYIKGLRYGRIKRKSTEQYMRDVISLRNAAVYSPSRAEAEKKLADQKKLAMAWAKKEALKVTGGVKNNMYKAMIRDFESPHMEQHPDGTVIYTMKAPFNQPGAMQYCIPLMDDEWEREWGERPTFQEGAKLPGYHPPTEEQLNALYAAKAISPSVSVIVKENTMYRPEFREHAEELKQAKLKDALNMSTDGFYELDVYSLRQLGFRVKPGWDKARIDLNVQYAALSNEAERKRVFGTDSYNKAKAIYFKRRDNAMKKYAPFLLGGVPERLAANKQLVTANYDERLHMDPDEIADAGPRQKALASANEYVDALEAFYPNMESAEKACSAALREFKFYQMKDAVGAEAAAKFVAEDIRAFWWSVTLGYAGTLRKQLSRIKTDSHPEYDGLTVYSDIGERMLHKLQRSARMIQDVEKKLGIESGFSAQWKDLGGATLGRQLLDWAR